ncbi:MAG TPA: response regulator [Chloroflexi bacterium]|nr:response regulator [Chloroflexota bacterium]
MTERGATSEAFVDAVQHALVNLYDPKELGESSLRRWLGLGERAGASELHRIILNAIEELKPNLEARKDAKAWRPYRAIYHRHVEQFTQREVSVALALSVRQLRREEHRALSRLAGILWERYNVAERAPAMLAEAVVASSLSQRPSSREDELQWLERSAPMELLDLAGLASSVLSVTEPLAAQLAVTLAWQPPDVPAYAFAQAASLRQALINVISCAMRAVPGGRVEMMFETSATDHGLVIRPYGSSGHTCRPLCADSDQLQMAQQLLEISAAELAVDASEDGMCSGTITLTIGAAKRDTVLVIDDNADTLRLVERYLADSRYAFAGVRDPEHAMELATRVAPAAILLDVMLPAIDGWEMLGRLRTHPAATSVPIIVCTILPEEHLALSLGAAEFLRKPINRQTLLAALDRQVATVSPAGDSGR